MKHYILTNPVSGNKKGLKYAIAIKKLLKKYDINSTIVVSEYPKQLTSISKKLSSKHTCRFYSIGGDGTLNEIIAGCINSNSEVVVIPSGTGNDFIKSVSKYMSLRKIISDSINKVSTPTDVIKVNNDKFCINVLNCGFDAMVAKNVDYFRIVPFITGRMKYNLAILYTLLRNKNYKFKLRINDKIIKNNFTLVAIANGKYYGGGIIPCPDAITNDSLLDICTIDSTRVFQKIKFLPKYKKGKHLDFKQVNLFKTENLHIVSNRSFPISADGEVFYSNKLSVKILPKSINIVHID